MALNKLKKWIGTQAMTAFFDQLNDNVDATNTAIDLAETDSATIASHMAENANKHIHSSNNLNNGFYTAFDDGTVIWGMYFDFPAGARAHDGSVTLPITLIGSDSVYPAHASGAIEYVPGVGVNGYHKIVESHCSARGNSARLIISTSSTTTVSPNFLRVFLSGVGKWR